jgi:hypothetical protein
MASGLNRESLVCEFIFGIVSDQLPKGHSTDTPRLVNPFSQPSSFNLCPRRGLTWKSPRAANRQRPLNPLPVVFARRVVAQDPDRPLAPDPFTDGPLLKPAHLLLPACLLGGNVR